MTPDDEDYEYDPDETDQTDEELRGLRAEVVRLEAKLDQLRAAVRDQHEEFGRIRQQHQELKDMIAAFEAKLRRFGRRRWVVGMSCAVVGATLAQVVFALVK